MTNRLELSWEVDGFIEEQRYYCSTSPINVGSLPEPKAVLSNDVRTYTDTDITEGLTYYVCIGSVKNGVEKLSEIKQVSGLGYRYYRIYITENNAQPYTALQEVEIAETVGGLDVTNTAMTTGQSSFYGQNNASKAFNNEFTNIDEAWVTATGQALPSWISIDLSSRKDVVEFRMWAQQYSYGLGRAPKDFVVQGSNDGATWTDIKSFSNVTGWVVGTAKKFNLITGVIT